MRWTIEIMLRALMALLLTLAVAAPAVAEIGCTSDAADHVAGITETAADAAIHSDATPDDGQDSGQDADRDGHCAFAHNHCGGIAPLRTAEMRPFATGAAFHPAPDPAFVSLSLIGPDRPPRG